MRAALIEEIELKRRRLLDVYEKNDMVAVSEDVLRVSQELDELIFEYLIIRETERC